MQQKYDVKTSSITDYKMFVKQIVDLFWEIDPNYSKIKSRGKLFPKMAEELFGFKKYISHGHAPKRLSSMSLSIKVQKLYTYTDRSYMDSSHMKSFKHMPLEVAKKLSDFVQEMQESNVRTKKTYHEIKNQESVIENCIVANIKTKTVYINTTWHNHSAKVHQSLKNSDIYKSIVINDLIHANNWTNFMKIVNQLLHDRIPSNFSDFSIYHFKVPSSSPHPAVHFL